MKLFALLLALGFYCLGCSHPLPHHLPDSRYYKQQEASLLASVFGQITKPTSHNSITKQDTIGIYDSLSFPHPSKKIVSKLTQEHEVSPDFIRLLNDTTNWSQTRHSTITLPIQQIAAHAAFTPKIASSKDDVPTAYRLSRVVFNKDFSKAFFQLTWSDEGGGSSKYVLCQKRNNGWVVQMAYTHSSFKF
ncbi:hypothetical protein [Hymenobacter jeollabukensis]|uniref:Uncharacterized protein n=1 Tax=Hymenobacter jeollabukensis TaxID=2025313 RepID=A0A5R8WQM0_9BACT|nr:hypothetical protein [Hymenobacter jeollabukensis]TLM92986.1 hypothetical protein FDY95_10130 [Hymenobacter jeollabukensis]